MIESKPAKETPIYTISAAAKILNITVHTIRKYEREGLIVPFKKESNQRLYSQEDIDRINCIRDEIKKKKISLNGIKTIYSMIPCWEIVKCTKREREKCNFFNGSNLPCWTYNHSYNICGTQKCRDCIVYTQYSECNNVKELVKSAAR